jgi:hypothetical protein
MTPSNQQYIDAARELHGGLYVRIVDEAPIERTEDGAYITAQLWVERSDALKFSLAPAAAGDDSCPAL